MLSTKRLSLLLLLWVSFCTESFGLFEDQIGKFDWHQKYLGHVRFIVNDLLQSKRIIVGTRDNIVGAINSNSGAILYRHVLESNTNLLHLGNFGEKHVLTVASRENQVKIRSFVTSNGVQADEWSLKEKADYATEFNDVIYLIETQSSSPDLNIASYEIKSDKKGEPKPGFEDNDDLNDSEKSLKSLGTKHVKTNLEKISFCEAVGPYLACVNGKQASIVHLGDNTAIIKEFPEQITEISGTASKDRAAFAFKGRAFVQVFQISQNEGTPIELNQLIYPSTAYYVTLSQTKVNGKAVLFVSRLETAHDIQVEAYDDQLERIEAHSFHVMAKNLIGTIGHTKVFCHNAACGLIGFTKDEILFGTKLESASHKIQVTWTRQESLASTLAVETVDYPSEAQQSHNPYSTQQGVFQAFISRIKYEIEAIVTGDRFYTSNDDRFGVKKVIVFVTSIGKVIGMDGTSGQILYAFLLPEFSMFKGSSVFLYLQRPSKYAPLKPLASVVYPSSKSETTTVLFPFNPIEGQHADNPQTYPGILQSQMLLHGTQATKFLKPVVLLDKNHMIHTYPSGVTDLQNLYFFVADKSSQTLKGLVVKEEVSTKSFRAKLLWNLSLGNELVGVHGKLPCEKIHSQGRVLPDRSVSYKYMNPNLVVVVTSELEAGNINVFLVDGVTGAVIHSLWHKKSRGPVHVVHSEHWIVYSLFNEKNRRYEITSIELYEGQKQSNSSAFSSFAAPPVQPLVIKQSYIFPSKIETMAYTRTEKGITNKDILLALPTGGILELPKFVMQPRLSAQHHQIHQDEDGVIHSVPYIPELPTPPDMIINYNQSVKRVRGIKTWPTRLESTCLILVYGVDIFYTKVAPSKHFDVLKDDFDHWFILLVLTALCVGAYVTKRLSARKLLEQAWR